MVLLWGTSGLQIMYGWAKGMVELGKVKKKKKKKRKEKKRGKENESKKKKKKKKKKEEKKAERKGWNYGSLGYSKKWKFW